jgi:riboflavin synthase
MFTGLVEGMATVVELRPEPPGVRLVIEAPPQFTDVALGDSICINGCCLTVVAVSGLRLEFQAGTETLSRTNLGALAPGNRVNVERSLAANARMGGHFVQGHVDGVGRVDEILPDGDWTTMWFRIPDVLAVELVSKGSIAVDGVSLTVVNVEESRFSVALIPHTLRETTLGTRRPGDPVNLETDILAKYVRRMLLAGVAPVPGATA